MIGARGQRLPPESSWGLWSRLGHGLWPYHTEDIRLPGRHSADDNAPVCLQLNLARSAVVSSPQCVWHWAQFMQSTMSDLNILQTYQSYICILPTSPIHQFGDSCGVDTAWQHGAGSPEVTVLISK